MTTRSQRLGSALGARQGLNRRGLFWLGLAVLGTLPLFRLGFEGLAEAWARPEFSHGPVIPVLSFYMFLRELKAVPPVPEPVAGRWPGVALIGLALLIAVAGNLAGIDHLVFYALIVWVAGLVLDGLRLGAREAFWPSVLHLVFMLPLPQFLYWKLSTALQLVSSGVGVELVRAGRRAGLPRRQHHRPRRLQAAGRRGLLGAALPLPDHELHLRLRRALPRARSGTSWCCSSRRCRWRSR